MVKRPSTRQPAVCRSAAQAGVSAVSAAALPVQALPRQDAEFDFGHVQTTAVAWRVGELPTPGQPVGLLGGEGLLERGDLVRVQVVADQLHLARLRVVLVQQAADFLDPSDARAAVPATDPPPAPQGMHQDCFRQGCSSFF